MRLREIKPGMVIHCNTEEEVKILFTHLKKQGVTWLSGEWLDEYKNCQGLTFDTCYHLCNDGLSYGSKHYFETKDMEITEFSDLIIPELSAVEVMKICKEMCIEAGHCCNCKMDGNCYADKNSDCQKVVEICEQWKADHEKKEPEKKEPEVEWFWQGRIYKVDDDKGNFYQLKDGNGFYDTGCKYREGAEEYMEELLKEYCKNNEGNYVAVVEHVCRVKQ